MVTGRGTHNERTQEVEPVVVRRRGSFRIYNMQFPEVSIDGNCEDGHFETVVLNLALSKLGGDPGRQLNHRVLIDVSPLDLDIDEERSEVGKA